MLPGTIGVLTASLFAVAACATSEAVQMRHPETGQTVTCGPYTVTGNVTVAEATAQRELRYCIEDYQRQGYVRAS